MVGHWVVVPRMRVRFPLVAQSIIIALLGIVSSVGRAPGS